MDDLLASIFIVFLLLFYAAIALAFVVAGIRTWIWQPLRKGFPEKKPAQHFHDIKSTHSEQSPS
ncbi:MAG: hypothetical protein M1404_02440 [Acidobacteria bacterium]|nr:hypothetical protein [Acidobacteriota bacterium]